MVVVPIRALSLSGTVLWILVLAAIAAATSATIRAARVDPTPRTAFLVGWPICFVGGLLGAPFGGRSWPAALALAVVGATVLAGLGALLLHQGRAPQRTPRTWLLVAATEGLLLGSLTANGAARAGAAPWRCRRR